MGLWSKLRGWIAPKDVLPAARGTLLLSENDLNFARAHIKKYYSSDFFPDPDEFDAVWAGWGDVVDYFAANDVVRLGVAPEDMLCAKATGGYRVVHQLHPLDAIAYTALAGMVAPLLEPKRPAYDDHVACSYRLDPNSDGRLFRADTDGYRHYAQRSNDLSQAYPWTLMLDIASFYNHIYIHRIENAIQALDKTAAPLARAVHEFLLNLNERRSIGIPVGPAASIVFAEAVLNDVDGYLRNHLAASCEYVRYVDDYRVFAKSRLDLEELWHDLSGYLYRSQRLSLAHGKCRLWSSQEFRDKVLTQPALARRSERAAILGLRFDEVAAEYQPLDERVPKPKSPLSERVAALREVLSEFLVDDELHIGHVRRILRRARELRIYAAVEPLVSNLEKVAPVARDAGLYLGAMMRAKQIAACEKHLGRYFERAPKFIQASHLHYWLAWLVSGRTEFANIRGVSRFIGAALPRFAARAARVRQDPAWVRDNRGRWQSLSSWDRWALVGAAEMLSPAERQPWLDQVGGASGSLMDRLVAKHAAR